MPKSTKSNTEVPSDRCKHHPKEKSTFYCKEDKEYFCSNCVNSFHKGHESFVLKTECATLFKPWLDLKSQITRFKKRLEEIKDKVPEDEQAVLEKRVTKFN